MRNRVKRVVAAATMVAAAYMVLGSATAGATVAPYAPGTMFIADQNANQIWEVPPGGGSPAYFDAYGQSPQDVAVDSAGNVYWTQLNNGTVDERPAGGGGDEVLASGFAPTGIAVDGSGNVYFGSFSGPGGSGLYEIPSGGGTPTLLTSRFGEFTSVAVDGNGDVWGVSGTNNLTVVPPGTSGGQLQFGLTAVRLDASNDIFGSAFGSAIELAPGAVNVTTLGTIGGYADGVAVDGSGNVFVGKSATVPGYGQVYEVPPGGGSATLYASSNLLASTHGLALYPPLSPASRSSSSISLSSSPGPGTVTTETQVTFTASLGDGQTGGVQFEDNGRPLSSATASSGGTASVTVTLPAGTHDITATYLGDGSHAPAISNDLSFTSNAVASSTVLSFPNGTTTPGDQPLQVNATVTGAGGTPTGSVTFYDGNINEGTADLDGSGNASIQFVPKPGSTPVRAVYTGDSTFAQSTSKPTTVTTNTPYTPTLTTTVKYGTPNKQGAVKATIKLTVTGVKIEPAPTGTVTADSGFTCTALKPSATTDKSTATCSHMVPSGTDESVNLTFTSGDGNYDSGSTSAFVSNGGGGV